MRLLMITRKVDLNDASPAAATYHLVKKIGEHLEVLHVITWHKSDRGDLPQNIKIVSLPENKIFKVFVLWWHLLKILPKVDGLFCHQNPEYTILAAKLAKIFRKKIITWYTHGTVSWKLRLVNLLADKILTASLESCRLKNRKKIETTGHGIDLEYFKPVELGEFHEEFRIISIGRISPAKDYEILIRAIEILVNKNNVNNLDVRIIGGPSLKSDKNYFDNLKQLVKENNLEKYVKFLGPVPYNQILPYYQNSDLFINLSQTGSIDKAVLEAMACGKMVLTSNEAFANILDSSLMVEKNNPDDLTDKIKWVMDLDKGIKEKTQKKLRAEVVKNHNLDNLILKIIESFKQ